MSATWQWAKANPDAAARRIRELERENAALRDALDDLLSTCEAQGFRADLLDKARTELGKEVQL